MFFNKGLSSAALERIASAKKAQEDFEPSQSYRLTFDDQGDMREFMRTFNIEGASTFKNNVYLDPSLLAKDEIDEIMEEYNHWISSGSGYDEEKDLRENF